jgi:hypothetical protein
MIYNKIKLVTAGKDFNLSERYVTSSKIILLCSGFYIEIGLLTHGYTMPVQVTTFTHEKTTG